MGPARLMVGGFCKFVDKRADHAIVFIIHSLPSVEPVVDGEAAGPAKIIVADSTMDVCAPAILLDQAAAARTVRRQDCAHGVLPGGEAFPARRATRPVAVVRLAAALAGFGLASGACDATAARLP